MRPAGMEQLAVSTSTRDAALAQAEASNDTPRQGAGAFDAGPEASRGEKPSARGSPQALKLRQDILRRGRVRRMRLGHSTRRARPPFDGVRELLGPGQLLAPCRLLVAQALAALRVRQVSNAPSERRQVCKAQGLGGCKQGGRHAARCSQRVQDAGSGNKGTTGRAQVGEAPGRAPERRLGDIDKLAHAVGASAAAPRLRFAPRRLCI